MSLITKYRPNTLNKIIGNEMTVAKLKNMLSRQEDQQRTFMLYGPTGCGKTTIGRIIARRLGCKELREYNAANTRGIDTIRELDAECRYAPLDGTIKVYLIDECHKLTNEAQNALLKLTEEPPPRVYFVLCTTDHQKMIDTLKKGRLARFKVERLNFVQITELLDHVLGQEGKEEFPRKAVRQIAKLADGCPRDALSLLDTVIEIEDEELLLQAILDSSILEGDIKELCRLLLETRINRWPEVFNLLEALTEEAEDIRHGISGYLRKVQGTNPDNRLGWIITQFLDTFIYSKRPGLYHACWEVVERDKRQK